MLNQHLLKLAREMTFKQANGQGTIQPITPIQPPPQPGGDPSQAQPQQGGAPAQGQIPGMDPMTAMMGSPQPQQQQAAAPPKLKPEQMMQMLDTRLYNMQQQITAIARAVNAQIDMGALVLPPGMQGAPPAETAIPGGPMDPTQQGAPPADPAAGGAPGGAPPADPAAAAAAGGAPKTAADLTELMIDGKPFTLEGTPKSAEASPLANTRIIAAAVSQMIRSHHARQAA